MVHAYYTDTPRFVNTQAQEFYVMYIVAFCKIQGKQSDNGVNAPTKRVGHINTCTCEIDVCMIPLYLYG